MKNKYYIFLAIAIVVLAGGVYFFGGKTEEAVNPQDNLGAIGEKNIENYVPAVKFNDGIKSALELFITGSTTVGSPFVASGQADVNGRLNHQGIGYETAEDAIVSTTTILARIQNPFSATTTYSNFACNITTATSTQTVVALYEAETEPDSYGTSTNGTALASATIASDVLGHVLSATIDNENILGPSAWLVAGYDSGTTPTGGLVGTAEGANQQAGNCSVLFREI